MQVQDVNTGCIEEKETEIIGNEESYGTSIFNKVRRDWH